MCGPLSCEHAGGIKAPFISSPLRRNVEKASFTEPCRLTPTHPNLSVTANLGLTGSLWESRCLSLMPLRCGLWGYAGRNYVSCSGMSVRGSPKTVMSLSRHTHTRPHMRPAHMKRNACGEASGDCLLWCRNVQWRRRLKIAGTIKVFLGGMCFRSDYHNVVI